MKEEYEVRHKIEIDLNLTTVAALVIVAIILSGGGAALAA